MNICPDALGNVYTKATMLQIRLINAEYPVAMQSDSVLNESAYEGPVKQKLTISL